MYYLYYLNLHVNIYTIINDKLMNSKCISSQTNQMQSWNCEDKSTNLFATVHILFCNYFLFSLYIVNNTVNFFYIGYRNIYLSFQKTSLNILVLNDKYYESKLTKSRKLLGRYCTIITNVVMNFNQTPFYNPIIVLVW